MLAPLTPDMMLGKNTKRYERIIKKNDELLSDPTPSKVWVSHSPSTSEASDDELEKVSKDMNKWIEWIARVDMEK